MTKEPKHVDGRSTPTGSDGQQATDSNRCGATDGARSDRPGGNVETDANGSTYERETGVSGEVASAQLAPRSDQQCVLSDRAVSRADAIDELRCLSLDARGIENANDDGMAGVAAPSNLSAVQGALRQLNAPEQPTTADPQAEARAAAE